MLKKPPKPVRWYWQGLYGADEADRADDCKTSNNASPGILTRYRADEDKEDGVGKVFKADEDKVYKMEEAEEGDKSADKMDKMDKVEEVEEAEGVGEVDEVVDEVYR